MKKKLENRFRGLYWRQLFVTAGMVMLTLVLAAGAQLLVCVAVKLILTRVM